MSPRLLRRQSGVWVPVTALPSGPVTPPANQAPTAVSGLSVAPSRTTATLTWGAATDPDGSVVGYHVWRGSTQLTTSPTPLLSFTATGLVESTGYSFTVRAVDNAGAMGPAATVSTTTLAPAVPGGKPGPADFGTSGSLTSYGGSGTLYLPAGTYQNYDFGSRSVVADAAGVTIRNCKAPSFVSYFGNFTLENVEAGYIGVDCYYRAIDHVRLSGMKINGTDGDGLNLFSVAGKVLSDVVVDGLYAAGFDYSGNQEAHGDGIQIRGVTGCTIRNATIDMGVWQSFGSFHPKNAAIYIENVNGVNGIHIEDVWLNGGGYTFYTAPGVDCSATRMRVDGSDFGYGTLLIEGGRPGGWTLTDCTGPTGSPL